MDTLQTAGSHVLTIFESNIAVQLLLSAILIDFLTGMARATKERKWNSTTGLNGWIRHGLIVLLTILVITFSEMFGASWFGFSFTLIFSWEYLISIMENWVLAGYEIPRALKQLLNKLPHQELRNGFDIDQLSELHDKNDPGKLDRLQERFTKEDK